MQCRRAILADNDKMYLNKRAIAKVRLPNASTPCAARPSGLVPSPRRLADAIPFTPYRRPWEPAPGRMADSQGNFNRAQGVCAIDGAAPQAGDSVKGHSQRIACLPLPLSGLAGLHPGIGRKWRGQCPGPIDHSMNRDERHEVIFRDAAGRQRSLSESCRHKPTPDSSGG